jgi:glycosyltransferase involved in cell wall biosynthesis
MSDRKIKISFYLANQGYPHVDLRFPEKGNPGIGGTEFTTIATAYYLEKFYSHYVDVLLMANIADFLPSSLKVFSAANEVEAAIKSEQEGCDIFVFKSRMGNHEIYEALPKLKIKAIARSNNTPDVIGLRKIADCQQIKAHVCVGQEQLDLLRDHRIFSKSIRIFDLFNPENFIPKDNIIKQGNTVVFLGNIIPAKGFHHLARVWPFIIKHRPDAKLIVLGSGQLYDRNLQLGKWGVAQESYEAKYIRPYLSDGQGNLISSVHFVGILDQQKINVLQAADVGVVNPSGVSEVCPGSALEIQACGTPVVSAAEWGLLDTVVHGKTGLLGNSERDLARNILYLLNNPAKAKELGQNGISFVRETFDFRLITKQWFELIVEVFYNRVPPAQSLKNNYFYRAKLLREGMRIIKSSIPALKNIPAIIEMKYLMKEHIKKLSF